MSDTLEEFHYFTSPVYAVKKPEFLDVLRAVSAKYLAKSKARKKTTKPITVMTGNFATDPAVAAFAQYVSQSSWNILNAQGYAADDVVTYFKEMWCQEHNFMSHLDPHFHGEGAQMAAFYFLDVPIKSAKLLIHDPRDAKIMASLPEKNPKVVSPAAHKVVLTPQEGTLVIFNSWMTHSISRHLNREKSMRFIHMNLGVAPAVKQRKTVKEPSVEII